MVSLVVHAVVVLSLVHTWQSPPAGGAGGLAAAQSPASVVPAGVNLASELTWVTRPPLDAVMSFTLPVEVRDIPVKPGQRVKKGELLVRARDGEVLAALEIQRLRAKNRAGIDSAKASLELAEVRYKRILEADSQGASNPQELDERRVSVDAAKASLANAESEFAQEQQRLLQLDEQVARYRIIAPFDGIIEQLVVDPGVTIEPPNPVLRIVNIDALWIELPTPTEETLSRNLATGSPAWVTLDVPGAKTVQGKVLYVSPVADAAAGTRRVRIEVANPNGYPPGTKAKVSFDKPQGFSAAPTQMPSGRRGIAGMSTLVAQGHLAPGAEPDPNCPLCAKSMFQDDAALALVTKRPRMPASALKQSAKPQPDSARTPPGASR